MPQNYKILGPVLATANALKNLYVTGSSTQAVINSIYICNQGTSNANVDIIVRPINEALENKHYYFYNQKVGAADTVVLNLGITMNADVILAANNAYRAGEAGTSNVSYGAFGIEIT